MSEQPLRVMVVDDHPMWRDAVERDLAGAGFDVVELEGSYAGWLAEQEARLP